MTSSGISAYAVNTVPIYQALTKRLLHMRVLEGHLEDKMCASEVTALVVPAVLAFTCTSVEPTV